MGKNIKNRFVAVVAKILKVFLIVLFVLYLVFQFGIFSEINNFLEQVFGFCGLDFALFYSFLLELIILLLFVKRRKKLKKRGDFKKYKRAKILLIIFLVLFLIIDIFLVKAYIKAFNFNKECPILILSDFDKTCYDRDDCRGECIASGPRIFVERDGPPLLFGDILPEPGTEVVGKCSAYRHILGCTTVVRNQTYQIICFD